MKISPVNMEARKKLDMRAGDTVRVNQKIQDKSGKTRLQAFEGIILSRKHGTEPGATFTVRRVSNGYGVEKIFPLYSPVIESIEITKRSKVKKAKLYHIRKSALKQIGKRMKMIFVDIKEEREEAEKEKEAEEKTEAKEVEDKNEPEQQEKETQEEDKKPKEEDNKEDKAEAEEKEGDESEQK